VAGDKKGLICFGWIASLSQQLVSRMVYAVVAGLNVRRIPMASGLCQEPIKMVINLDTLDGANQSVGQFCVGITLLRLLLSIKFRFYLYVLYKLNSS